MAFDWQGLLKLLLGTGEAAGGVATGNPLLAMQGIGSMAQGGAGMAGAPGFGNTAGPPSPTGTGGMFSQLGQLGGGLTNATSAMAPLLQAGNMFQPQPMQAAPIAQPGAQSPFMSSPPPSSSLGGNNQLMMLLQKLLGSGR